MLDRSKQRKVASLCWYMRLCCVVNVVCKCTGDGMTLAALLPMLVLSPPCHRPRCRRAVIVASMQQLALCELSMSVSLDSGCAEPRALHLLASVTRPNGRYSSLLRAVSLVCSYTADSSPPSCVSLDSPQSLPPVCTVCNTHCTQPARYHVASAPLTRTYPTVPPLAMPA